MPMVLGMKRIAKKRLPGWLFAGTLVLVAVFWTGAGETFDPILPARELPLEIISCTVTSVAGQDACISQKRVTSRWIGRSARGDLFLVLRSDCRVSNDCHAWVVERTTQGTATLLGVNGEIRLYRGDGVYPTVQSRQELSEVHSSYTRFEWHGDQYVSAEKRMVYRVAGVECGTRTECVQAAREALRHDDADSTVKIYEHVHGVSWI